MSALFPFVTLKSLNDGYSYYGKVKKLLNEEYYNSLKKIKLSDIEKVAKYINGINLKNKIFESLEWLLHINPIPDLEIYFLCATSGNKNEFSVLYGRDSRKVPTKEIYAFTLLYILTLSRIGNDELEFENFELNGKLLSIKSLYNSSFNETIDKYFESLKLLNISLLKKRLSKYSHFVVKEDSVFYKVFNDFFIKFRINDNNDILINEDAFKKHSSNLIITFVGLVINALKRELIK